MKKRFPPVALARPAAVSVGRLLRAAGLTSFRAEAGLADAGFAFEAPGRLPQADAVGFPVRWEPFAPAARAVPLLRVPFVWAPLVWDPVVREPFARDPLTGELLACAPLLRVLLPACGAACLPFPLLLFDVLQRELEAGRALL